MNETFLSLLHNRAHWGFELFVGLIETLVIDGVLLGLVWPFLRKHWAHHKNRDQQEGL